MNKKILMKQGPFEIRAAGENVTELLIYGDIGESWFSEGVTAKEVVKQLQDVKTDEIVVRINSFGGSVADGLAIYNALKRHDALVTTSNEGVAYSIASLMMMAGDTVQMASNSLFMVHAPWGISAGNSSVMREYADILDKYAESMTASYVAKSGQTHDEIMTLLTDGTDHYYSAEEAKDAGFIDVITDEIQIAASAYDMTRYQRYPAAAAAPNQPENKPAPKNTEVIMKTDEEIKAAAEAEAKNTAKVEKAAVEKAALEKEGERKSGIRAAFKPFAEAEGVQDILDTCIDDYNISAQAANDRLLTHLGKNAESLAAQPDIDMGLDAKDKFAKGAALAIGIRAGLEKEDTKNEFRSYSLIELGRKALALNNVDTSRMGKMDLVAAALTHSTGDFTSLLANNANKAMLRGYEEADETFQVWTNPGDLPDFKAGSRVGLNDFPSLNVVPEGAEFKYATIGERAEPIVLATYGNLFSITRQAIINDDLQAFVRIPRKMGSAAIRTVGDLVYAILTTNGNMSDGVALFHATHSNLMTGTAILSAAVDTMRVAMATQKAGGKSLNIRLGNLVVPMALEGAAKIVRDSEKEVLAAKTATTPNSVRGTFEVISDGRLDDTSATAWYGTAIAGMHDTIEVAYLDGNQAPRLEQQDGWTVDGAEFKVALDAGVSPLDYRTMAYNPGP